MNKGENIFLYFLAFVVFLGCSTPSRLVNKDFALLYSPKANKIDCWFKVFHYANNRSVLYISYSASNLLYAKPFNDEHLQCNIRLHYKLFSEGDNPTLLDSASFIFKHPKNDSLPRHIDSIPFACGMGRNYIMEISVKDLNRKEEIEEILFIDKTHLSNENAFLIRNRNRILFNQNSVDLNDSLQICYSDSNVRQLSVFGYFKEFNIAAPPYSIENSVQDFKPDTHFVLTTNKQPFRLVVKHLGYYLITTDTAQKKGGFFRAFGANFPEISTYAEMIPPLRYLCTRHEFELLQQNTEPKKAIDKFWLDLGGNRERAKELIKQYYNRVQYANLYFSSYKQGWKTDRGMIYTVFGAPNFVSRSYLTEVWTYGEQHNFRSLVFFFTRNEKSINSNDFILDRNPLLKDEWMQAVDVWRQGRVFNPYN